VSEFPHEIDLLETRLHSFLVVRQWELSYGLNPLWVYVNSCLRYNVAYQITLLDAKNNFLRI